MMKKTTPLLLATLALFAIGCNQKTSKNSNTSTSDQYNYLTGGANGGTNGNVDGGNNGSTNGNPQTGGTGYWPWTYIPETKPIPSIVCSNLSATGETCTDFDSVYSTIPTYPIVIAGGGTWGPGLSPTGEVSIGAFPTVNEMVAVTQTDKKLRVRFRMLSQPKPIVGKEYCLGRETGQSADYCPYSKLKLRVGAVPKAVWQQFLNDQNPYLGNYMKTITHDNSNGISVGKCSVWYDLDHVGGEDYVIVVQDISSDNECRYQTGLNKPNHGSCPNNTIVKTGSCASIEMQVQTDYTSY